MAPDPERETPPGLATGGTLTDRRSTEPTTTVATASVILAELCQRATVTAYRERGPMPVEVLERAARDLRYAAAGCLAHGDDAGADHAERAARDVEDTAEIAKLIASARAA
jgi:hypothetical protein